MDPKKQDKPAGNDKDKKTKPTGDTSGNEPGISNEDIATDPITAEKDEVKIAEEKFRNKTNNK